MSLGSNEDGERGKLGKNDGQLHLEFFDSGVPVSWVL